MQFSVIEIGPHYGTTLYYAIEGPQSQYQQFYMEDAELAQQAYDWGTLVSTMEGITRAAIYASGETDLFAIRAAIQDQVFTVMPIYDPSMGVALQAQKGAAAPVDRRVDPPVKTLADHEARLKRMKADASRQTPVARKGG